MSVGLAGTSFQVQQQDRPQQKQKYRCDNRLRESPAANRAHPTAQSDHLTSLRAYMEWDAITETPNARYGFARENFLGVKTLQATRHPASHRFRAGTRSLELACAGTHTERRARVRRHRRARASLAEIPLLGARLRTAGEKVTLGREPGPPQRPIIPRSTKCRAGQPVSGRREPRPTQLTRLQT